MNVFVLKNGYKQISVVANGVYDMLKNQNVVYALKLWCWNFFQTKFQPLEVTHLMSMDGWQKNTQNMTSLKTNKQKPYANVHWRRNNRSGDSNRCSTQRIQYTCYVAISKRIVPFYIYLTISIAHIFAAREWVLFSLFFVIFFMVVTRTHKLYFKHTNTSCITVQTRLFCCLHFNLVKSSSSAAQWRH